MKPKTPKQVSDPVQGKVLSCSVSGKYNEATSAELLINFQADGMPESETIRLGAGAAAQFFISAAMIATSARLNDTPVKIVATSILGHTPELKFIGI